MRAVWHLAINSLIGRKARSALLASAVALATCLTVTGGALLSTLERSLHQSIGQIAGLTDLQIQHRFGARFDRRLLAQVRLWPQVKQASGRLETSITLQCLSTRRITTAVAVGIEPAIDHVLNPQKYLEGEPLSDRSQIVIDQQLRNSLKANVGDRVKLVGNAAPPNTFQIVGVIERPRLVVLQRAVGLMMIEDAAAIVPEPDRLDQIDIQLHAGLVPDQIEHALGQELPAEVVLRSTASANAGINRYLQGVRMVGLCLFVLTFASAAILVVVGMTTALMQRMRELAILRCFGTPRWLLAMAQVLAGLLLSGSGALIGAPLGLLLAYGLYRRNDAHLIAAFDPNYCSILLALAGAMAVGVLGTSYPAVKAGWVQPLQALAARANPTQSGRPIVWAVCGLTGMVVQPILWTTSLDLDTKFRLYLFLGMPSLFLGYFLLSVPVLTVLTRGAAPLLGRLLRLPRGLLGQSVLATPVRLGLTGGAMMVGLAMLVAIWTTARGVLNEYVLDMKMPDAFAHRFFAMSREQETNISNVPAVTRTCSMTMFPVEANVKIGLEAFSNRRTQFVSFEPDAFFAMTHLQWVQGNPRQAGERLKQGRALLVAKEFMVSNQLGLGDMVTLKTIEGPVEFEVVGVVSSPGLDVAVHFFGIRRSYIDAALGSVFGSRRDAGRYFGIESANLMLLSLRKDVSEAEALLQIRRAGSGITAGSSRIIRRRLHNQFDDWLTIISSVAVGCLVLAAMAVGSVIMAHMLDHQYEYGVLRAVGTPRSMLARLIAGQISLIAGTGCVVGTGLGLELAWLNRIVRRHVIGLEYKLQVPWDVLAWGWATVIVLAWLAALPAVCRLLSRRPRALLAAGD